MAFLPTGGTRVELLEPTSADSPVGRYIAARGEGIHHLCFEVDDLEATTAELTAKGFRLVSGTHGRGAGGTRVCFVHPKSAGGVLIELCEVGG